MSRKPGCGLKGGACGELTGQVRRVAVNSLENERSSDNLLREDLFSHLYIEEEDGSNLKHIKRMVQIDQG